MKKKIKNGLSKVPKIFLVLLMTMTCINLRVIKDINALTLDYQAVSSSVKSANIDNIWGKGHSAYKLKMGGNYGFCLDLGKAFKGGNYYDRGTLSGIPTIVRKAMNWYYAGSESDARYWTAQVIIWGIMEGKISDPYDDFLKVGDELENVYQAIYGESVPSGYWASLGETCRDISQGSSEGDFYSYTYTAGYQRIATNAKGDIPVAAKRKVDSSKTYSLTDKIQLNINKTDVDTANGLAGAEFDLYRDNVKISTVTTGTDGKVSYTFEKVYTQSETASATYCDNYDELSPGNKDLIGNVDFTSRAAAQAEADKQALAKAKTAVQSLLDEEHEYKAIETKTRNEYYLDASKNTVIKEYASGGGSGSITFSLTNKRQLGSVTITKRDSETNNLVDNAIYGLYARSNIVHPDGVTGILYTKDQLVGTFAKTGANGQSTLNNLYLGQYYVSEITAPSGYLHSSEKYNVDLTYAGQNVQVTDASTTVKDKVQRAKITSIKQDKELDNGSKNPDIFDFDKDGAQGDATRTGATYGLYAHENINHADGTTGIVQYNQVNGSIHELKAAKGTDLQVKNVKANAGTLLATIKTDSNGEFGFDHLYNGKYYIQEMTPSEGYTLDPTKYYVDLSYTNQNEQVVIKSNKVLETVAKQAFDIAKVGHVPGTSTNATPLGGVEFTVWLESDIQSFINKGKTLDEAKQLAPVYDKLVTASDGTASSIELPYGKYRVAETKGAADHNIADDFFVTVSEDSRIHQSFTNNIIINEKFIGLIEAVKLDRETGKQVKLEGTEFKIKNLDKDEYIGYWEWFPFPHYVTTWTTNSEGYVRLQEEFEAGNYQLEEIYAPVGYVLDTEPVQFRLSKDNMYQTAEDGVTAVIRAYKSDVSAKGKIEINKNGEVLTAYDQDTNKFIYEVKGLRDAEYDIFANEDILDPSNDGTVLFEKDELITTLKTTLRVILFQRKNCT